MCWFRANKSFGGGLALFALALQFYLAFGHIHPDDIYGPAEITLPASVSIALPAGEALRAIPADRALGDAEGLCPICEAMAFLATSFVPEVPKVSPRSLVSRLVEHVAAIEAVTIAARRAVFQSRAPPHA
jgi:hypothetical protein